MSPSARRHKSCWTTSTTDRAANSASGATTRLALLVEYDGASYSGWQVQSHAPSVQVALGEAISAVANETVKCTGAGRTDAGVHASGQVAHFDTRADRSLRSWLLGINSNLADDIGVQWVAHVPDEFHARFSALSRSYRYTILNQPVRSPLARDRAWWVREPLDLEAMKIALAVLRGEHDFTSFRAAACQAHSPVRTIQDIEIDRDGDRIVLNCRANAFLHHMVRNIVGSLLPIGLGERDSNWFADVLAARDRKAAGMTAPPHGLCLTAVEYAENFALDTAERPFW